MKHTSKRIISMLLSLLMLVSMVSVYTFAMPNTVRDDNYYNSFTKTAVIVATEWNPDSNNKITYSFRGKEYTETYDEKTHFTSIQEAYEHVSKTNIAPVMIICEGVYSENITINTDITILGSNAGINPNTKGNNVSDPWTQSKAIGNKTVIRGLIEVDKFIETDIAVEFDGVTFANGFAYIDTGLRKATSTVSIYNSLFESLGPVVYKQANVNTIFYFEKAKNVKSYVKIDGARVTNMTQASLFASPIFNIEVSNMYYANCTMPLMNAVDGLRDTDPVYSVKDSMFYNNVTPEGVLLVDHAINDTNARNSTEMTVSNTIFIEGEANLADKDNATKPFITYNVVGEKNKLNVTGSTFIALEDHDDAPIDFVFTTAAASSIFRDSIKINNNKFFGFVSVNSTGGLLKETKIDYSANYFAYADGTTSNPVYPASSSYTNIKIDYFWIDKELTVPSNIFHLNKIGYSNYNIDHVKRTIDLEIAQGEKFDFEFETIDDSTTFKAYSDPSFTKEIKTIDAADLYTGYKKNVFYVVGTSDKCDGYVFAYTLYITTYNPDFVSEFNAPNTYLYYPDGAKLESGAAICKDWNGTAYKFILGKTAFATIEEIYAVCKETPTILLTAGTYKGDICLTRSTILLGAKHGVNPNLPQFENPEAGWNINPERDQIDQETTIEKGVIYLHSEAVNAIVTIDGITLGEQSGIAAFGEITETYSTFNISNILVANAGGVSFKEKLSDGKETARTASYVFSFGVADKFEKQTKDIRISNVRMENQGTMKFFGAACSSLLIDGLYFHGNKTNLFSGELTAPKGQNFKLEIRNSCFHQNTTGSAQFFLVNNQTTYTEEREYSKVILDNNIFYDTCQYQYGVYGIRFNGEKDSLYVTNNIFIAPNQKYSIQPGDTGWFIGFSGTDKTPDEKFQQYVSDVVFRYNRFIGPIVPVDMSNVKKGTVWNFDYNYFSKIDSSNYVNGIFDKKTEGVRAEVTYYSDKEPGKTVCNTYFKDYDMTIVENADEAYKTELNYTLGGNGVINEEELTYTDSVSSNTGSYTFDIKLDTKQAKYGVYAEESCTTLLGDTVELTGETNEFFIKFSSYDGSVTKLYKATISKPLSSNADILWFGNYSIGENTINAVLPENTLSITLDGIRVSTGASYTIYNDIDKTTEFVVNKITFKDDNPIVKYIEVTSQDGTNNKLYTLTLRKGISDLKDILSVENATKVDDTTFLATIPLGATSFEFIPNFSAYATLTIDNEGQLYEMTKRESYTVNNIAGGKDISIVVKAQDGSTKNYTLKLVADKTTIAINTIYNMVVNGYNQSEFNTTVNASTFKVLPEFKNAATTFKVYADKDLTKLCENNIVTLYNREQNAYLVATSEDGSNTKVFTLKITSLNPDLSRYNGWVYENDSWYYYINTIMVKNQWQKDSHGWCYLGADGKLVTNAWVEDSKTWCYIGSDGYCVTNSWVMDAYDWCYLDANGNLTTNAWVKDSQGWYYLGEDGYAIKNTWKADSQGWCYLGKTGLMVTNKWVMDSLGWCYVGAEGYCLTNAWVEDSQGWCYVNSNGTMVTDTWVEDSIGLCYIDSNGYWDGKHLYF